MRRLFVALSGLALAAFGATPAFATTITIGGLTLNTTPSSFYQQTQVNPCVIGAPNCQNAATFPFTSAGSGGNGSVFDAYSPLYSAAQIAAFGSYQVGFDWNQNSADQAIYTFEAIYYNGATEIGRQTWDAAAGGYASGYTPGIDNNGNGYSDFLLSGFVLNPNATDVKFHAVWLNNDGADRYFLIAGASTPCDPNDPNSCLPLIQATPEPATLLLFGTGLAAVAYRLRRRI